MLKVDLIVGGRVDLGNVLREACKLGALDATEGRGSRSGKSLTLHFCSAARVGHRAFIRSAYTAGALPGRMSRKGLIAVRYTAFIVVWVAGLVAGLLLRSSAGVHGLLPALAVVLTTAGAAGFAYASPSRGRKS